MIDEPDWNRLLEPARASGFEPGFVDRVETRLEEPSAAEPSRIHYLRPAMAAAAAILLFFGYNGLRLRATFVPPGERILEVALSDGSAVDLSPGSTLRYRDWLMRWGARKASLDGEAFFDVATADRPFEVTTFNAVVRVSGTRFNVRAWPDAVEPESVIALEEGVVSVSSRSSSGSGTSESNTSGSSGSGSSTSGSSGSGSGGSGQNPRVPPASNLMAGVTLVPGQVARVTSDGPVTEATSSVPDETSWVAGGLAFRDRPLRDVLRALERRFGLEISADVELVRGRRTTYIDPAPSGAEAVLDAVAFALGLQYTRTANGFRLIAGSSPPPSDPLP